MSRDDPTHAEVLEHYSTKPMKRVRSARQADDLQSQFCGKPRGLWVSVKGEDDWASWCQGEQWGLDRLVVRHSVVLTPGANILRVSGVRALDDFHHRYSVTEMLGRYSRSYIDWRFVAKKFDGILIAPYVWERRLEKPLSDWYYGWDCASGVIWNARAVAQVTCDSDRHAQRGDAFAAPSAGCQSGDEVASPKTPPNPSTPSDQTT